MSAGWLTVTAAGGLGLRLRRDGRWRLARGPGRVGGGSCEAE